jgi:hypothetical protein
LGSTPEHFGLDLANPIGKKAFTYFKEGNKFLWYKESLPSLECVMASVSKEKTLLFFDRIKGSQEAISIKDHVNISGLNGLIGQTPIQNFPMFPDMTNIYISAEGFAQKTVYTVGKSRFSEPRSSNKIVSEAIGILAPLFKYIEIKVMGIGIPYNIAENDKTINNCIQKLDVY